MKAGLISDEPLRVAFALSNLGGRAEHSAYTKETTSPRCSASWDQLWEPLRATLLLANNESRQRTRFLACKHIKTTVFMDGLKVGSTRIHLYRDQERAMVETTQIALQEEYSHNLSGTPREEEHRHDENDVPREAEHRSNDAVASAVTQTIDTGAYSEPEPMELNSAESLVHTPGKIPMPVALPQRMVLLYAERSARRQLRDASASWRSVLMRPETTREELNSTSGLDEGVLEDLNKQRQTRLGSEILKNSSRCTA
ncbi:hypothetical protein PInf_022050 [Phytophthora infestans]|nr:hypothetical protein PInf_022050 [Phytophthora infestans]